MFNDSIIKKTNQWWKASLAFWGVVGSNIILVTGLTNLKNEDLAISLVLTGIIIGITSVTFACSAIRCPICKTPWVWQIINNKKVSEWLHQLLNQSECPKCNNTRNTKTRTPEQFRQ